MGTFTTFDTLMVELGGIGKEGRRRLAKLLAATHGVIRMSDVVDQLGVTREQGKKLLSRWHQRGWLLRVQRGLYIPVPMDVQSPDLPLEEPWILASHLFSPCYISGWSAARYWDFTDQIYETTVVVTSKQTARRKVNVGRLRFLLKRMPHSRVFGTAIDWKEGNRIEVADPTRTILDVFDDPRLAGGIRSACDFFKAYIESEYVDFNRLIDYARRLSNGTVFKRLGFVAEHLCPNQKDFLQACMEHISAGYSQLDPSVKGHKIATCWRLKMPIYLKEWR